MKSKKSLMLILIGIMIMLAGCNNDEGVEGGSNETKEIRVSNTFGIDHPQNQSMLEKFKPLVEEKSNGSLTVEVYENGKLGGEKEVYDGVRNGTIDMVIAGTIMSGDVPKMSVGDWPFLFKDLDHAKKVLNGPIGDEIASELEETAGVKTLGWSANGFRMFSSNEPIQSMEDLQGVKMRLPNIPNFVSMGEYLGANVTTIPFSEVFTALEQGVIDGQDNPISTLRANGWYEVQNYVLESNHVFSLNIYLVSNKLWESLTDEEQQILESAAQETADYEWELTEESYQEDKEYLENNGIEFITPDEEFLDKFNEAMVPFYDDIYEEYPWAEEMVQNIKESN